MGTLGLGRAARFLSGKTGTDSLTWCSADEAVGIVRSGQSVFVQGAAMTPVELVTALAHRAGPSLKGVTITSIHTEGPNELASEAASVSFRCAPMFLGANVRAAVAAGRADYVPCFLSEIPGFYRSGTIPVDVALIQVSPPDKHGFCSLGVSVDVAAAAVEKATHVIALVNPNVPRTLGDGRVHVSKIDRAVASNAPIARNTGSKLEPLHEQIGKNIASLVSDGACIQAGIGLVPDAALLALQGHKELGVHTEMFSDGLLSLVNKGVITNQHKGVLRGKTTTAFAVGSQALLDYCDDNPNVLFLETGFTNDTNVIRKNSKTVAINSAIEVDLTGQARQPSAHPASASLARRTQPASRLCARPPAPTCSLHRRRSWPTRSARTPSRASAGSSTSCAAQPWPTAAGRSSPSPRARQRGSAGSFHSLRRAPASSRRARTCTGSSRSTASQSCTARACASARCACAILRTPTTARVSTRPSSSASTPRPADARLTAPPDGRNGQQKGCHAHCVRALRHILPLLSDSSRSISSILLAA